MLPLVSYQTFKNPLRTHPERLAKVDRVMVNDLNYEGNH